MSPASAAWAARPKGHNQFDGSGGEHVAPVLRPALLGGEVINAVRVLVCLKGVLDHPQCDRVGSMRRGAVQAAGEISVRWQM